MLRRDITALVSIGQAGGTAILKRTWQLGCLLMGMTGAALPGAARADVMEIGSAGYSWTAGGPAAMSDPTALPPAAGLPGETLGLAGTAVSIDDATPGETARFDGMLHPASVTEALDAAGPTRWREAVARLARKYDISPALLEAVVWQESRWNEVALSPVGARGLAQLMPGTAAQMGINPSDPAANLEGGARYLRMQLDAFNGNIEKALAAYNAGPNRVIAAGGIPNIRETRAYVASIMARLTNPVRQ